MTLGSWCSIAWASLFDNLPMLSNPGEYRTMMYKAFYLGEMPAPERKKMPRGKPGTPPPAPRPSSGPPQHVMREFERERQRILAMQAEKKTS